MTGNQTMDYYVRPRHLYSHSRTCTRSGLCRIPSRLVASLICYLLDRASVHEISALVTWFQYMSDVSSHYGDLDLLYLQPLWRSWSFVYPHHGDSDLCIVRGDDHICVIMFHAYSWPLYSYVSGTAICICSYMQSCIMVLCWLGGWSSIWVPSSLHFWDGLIMYFGHRITPLISYIRGHLL